MRLEPFTGKFSFFFLSLSLAIPQFRLLSYVSSLRWSSGHSGLVLILSIQPAPPYPAPAHWWWMWAFGLLLCWEWQLGVFSVFVFVFFSPGYFALWDSKTSHRPTRERVYCCVETFPLSQPPPQDGSPSLTLLSLFLSFIFCPTSFWREWAAFLGAWCPPPAFRSCFVEVAQHSNDLLMNLWERKWSPHPIPPPSRDWPPYLYFYWSTIDLKCCISFRYTAKWFSYIYVYMYIFSYIKVCVCVYIYIYISLFRFLFLIDYY